jgi:hypothetical protein
MTAALAFAAGVACTLAVVLLVHAAHHQAALALAFLLAACWVGVHLTRAVRRWWLAPVRGRNLGRHAGPRATPAQAPEVMKELTA